MNEGTTMSIDQIVAKINKTLDERKHQNQQDDARNRN